jgi:hypothetical protein
VDLSVAGTPSAEREALVLSCKPAGNWAVNFAVNWNKLSDDLVEALQNNCRPSLRQRREFVRAVAQEIRKVTPKPGRHNLRIIAAKIVAQWPGCFEDKIGDVLIGSGIESLLRQLEKGVDNINRGKMAGRAYRKRDVEKRLTLVKPAAAVKVKTTSIDLYGCIDGNPISMPKGETAATLEEKRNVMVRIHQDTSKRDDQQILNLMSITYYSQRKMIADGKSVGEILKMFPLLFSPVGMYCHFKKLTGVSMSMLRKSVKNQSSNIFSFMKTVTVPLVKETVDRVKAAKRELRCDLPDIMGIICLLAAFFKEDVSSFLLLQDSKDAVTDFSSADLPLHPCLIVRGMIVNVPHIVPVGWY